MDNIPQKDLDSGKVVQTTNATYWFKEPGNNMQSNGNPIWENLHRNEWDGPTIAYNNGEKHWYRDSVLEQILMPDGTVKWHKNSVMCRKYWPNTRQTKSTKGWYNVRQLYNNYFTESANNVNPFDLLSGKVAITNAGIFYFKEAGYNVGKYGYPIFENLHRDGDLPACLWNNSSLEWYKYGECHRENDLPAVMCYDGRLSWCKNGKKHRDKDLPSLLCYKEHQYSAWHLDDMQHRENNLPAMVFNDGTKKWLYYDYLHRTNGPAIERHDGSVEWWIYGKEYTKEEYNKALKDLQKPSSL